MKETRPALSAAVMIIALVLAGVAGWTAWHLPVRWKSLHPRMLAEAGRTTPQLVDTAWQALLAKRPGLAGVLYEGGQDAQIRNLSRLSTALNEELANPPSAAVLGVDDPNLTRLFPAVPVTPPHKWATALEAFLPEENREALSKHLETSRSPGVAVLLRSGDMRTRQFIPAGRAGGQPLEAIVLMTGLLYENERFSPELGYELKTFAEEALDSGESQSLEQFYVHLLFLSRRMNFCALMEVVGAANDSRALANFTKAVGILPDHIPLLATTAIVSRKAGPTGKYVLQYGTNSIPPIRQAVADGEGAVRLLVSRQLLVDAGGPSLSAAVPWTMRYPIGAVISKFGLFYAVGLLCALALNTVVPLSASPHPEHRASWLLPGSLMAFIIAGLLLAGSEPMLLLQLKPIDFQLRLRLPTLTNPLESSPGPTALNRKGFMDLSTILSIAIFAALQVIVYLICLWKIREIARRPDPSLVKLRLMENEENLFDGGLYLGIAGTAAALVLQVLGVIEANLLAAYSSNLFGILCVALVKIRHVRPFKRELILASQFEERPIEETVGR